MENLNAEMIGRGVTQKSRLESLNKIAKNQYDILQDSSSIKKIEALDNNNNNKNLLNNLFVKVKALTSLAEVPLMVGGSIIRNTD